MADGSIVIQTELDNKKAMTELNRLTANIEKMRAKLNAAEATRNPLADRYAEMAVQLDLAKQKLEEMQQASQGTYTADQIAHQKENVVILQYQWNKVATELERVDTNISRTGQKIRDAEVRAGELAEQLSGAGASGSAAGTAIGDAMEAATRRIEKLGRRIVGLVKRVFFFSLITKALRTVRNYVSVALNNNDEFAASLARLKGALMTAFQPIFSVIVPALTFLANMLAKVINAIASFIAILSGKSLSDYQASAKALDDESKAISGVGGAAAKASKQLAAFDEINKLGEDSGGGGGGGAAATGPDFTAEDWLGQYLEGMEAKVTAGLLLGGVALIALGAALGNLGLVLAGLGLIGAGIVYGMNSGTLKSWSDALGLDNVESFVTSGLLLAGLAAIAIGAALGNILLVVAGAALLGAGIVYGTKTGTIQSWVKKLKLDSVFDYVTAGMQLAGIALVAIGAAMGQLWMVIAGAAILGLGIAADAIGRETLSEWWETLKLTSVQQWVGVVMMLGGIALVAIGAATANLLLIIGGLALIGVATATNAAGGNLRDWVTALGLQKVVAWVTAALLLAGIALLVIGIVTANPLMVLAGIGLLGAGVSVGLTSGTFDNWLSAISGSFQKFAEGIANRARKLLEDVQGVWDKCKQWFSDKIAPIFTAEWWGNKFGAIREGLKMALNGVITAIENAINWIGDKLNSIAIDIPPVFGSQGAHLGFDIPRITIPRLAAGAVIPPNREFLAMLGDQKSGTNIEAPLETMVAAFRQALGEGAGSRTLVLQVGQRELGRIVFDAYNTENSRVGVKIGGLA